MKGLKFISLPPALILSLLALAASASADQRYVDARSATPSAPYTNWATAGTQSGAAK